MSLGYDFDKEARGSNIISGKASLRAQRFNPTLVTTGGSSCHGTNVTGNWESLTFGMPNVASNKVSNIVVNPNDFFKDWILVDVSTPLPVELLKFEALCKNGPTILNWSTASENNNDYFMIEKSLDGFNFFTIATVQGSGNSNTLNNYSYRDNTPSIHTSYYRLKQVDFDGKQEYFDIISSSSIFGNNFIVDQEVFGDNSLQFNIYTSNKEKLDVSLFDFSGRQIKNKHITLKEGSNQVEINDLKLNSGVYILNITGEINHHSVKLFKQ